MNKRQNPQEPRRRSQFFTLFTLFLCLACSASSPTQKLVEISSLEGSYLAPPFFYWTEFVGERGTLRRIHLQKKTIETLHTTPHHLQQIAATAEGLLWFQRSTSYEEPNRLIFFDRAPKHLAIEFLPEAPQMSATSDGTYFINRGRVLHRINKALNIEPIVKLPGSALELRANDLSLYVLEREFNGVTYSHNALLQIDAATRSTKTILGPPYSPLSFVAQGSIFATARHLDSDLFMVVHPSADGVRELLRTSNALSLITANQESLFFIQHEARGAMLYQMSLTSPLPSPVAGPFAAPPTQLFVDGDSLYWIGIADDGKQWLQRRSSYRCE